MQTLEPTWEIAKLFPPQSTWLVEEYLALDGNRLVEYDNGRITVLPKPSEVHQNIVFYLWFLLRTHLQQSQQGGHIVGAPFPIYVTENKYREPDVAYLLPAHREWRKTSHWEGADLVMEVISPDNPKRDTVHKRFEYAKAGIPEYWLIDPRTHTITVLVLDGDGYREHGVFAEGSLAGSVLLAGFEVDVTDVFARPG